MPPRGWRGVQLDILFGQVLGVLLPFIDAFEVQRFGVAIERDEVRAHGAGFERAIFAINKERPGVIRISRGSPGAVLPRGIEVVEFERRRLRVGNVRFALFLDVNAAG